MYLTASSLAPWMIRRGLLDPADVVRGCFAVEQIERHNRGFLVRSPPTRPLYVKQLTALDRFDIACLNREAHFLRLATTGDFFAPIRQAMPEFVDFDESRFALSVKLIADSTSFLNRAESAGGIPQNIAHQAGELIAHFESRAGQTIAEALDPELCAGQPPWILSFHFDQGDGWLSQGQQELLRFLQDDSSITTALDRMRTDWTSDSLMHADLKWDNILAITASAAGNGSDCHAVCRLIDWEMVDRGDAAWDAATMLQCWWWYWVMSTPPRELTTLDDLEEKRIGAFDEHRPSLDAFWRGYVHRLTAEAKQERLTHCLRLAAARLLQTTYELLPSAVEVSPQARLLLEMSRRFIEDPDSAQPFLPGVPA